MKIVVIGNQGRIGSTLYKILSVSGNSVTGIDSPSKDNIYDTIDQADIALVATPFDVTVNYLHMISSRLTCIEVTSTKCAMLPFRNRVISIHPLFGPLSYRKDALRNIAFISDISPPESLQMVQDLFQHFHIIPMTSVEHDVLVSKIQVIPYIISLLAQQVRADTQFKTRSKEILDSMAAVCDEQSMTVLMDTITMNPFSLRVLGDIEEKMKKLGGELSDRCSNFWLQH